jgi:type IV pilus assembly protein PilB
LGQSTSLTRYGDPGYDPRRSCQIEGPVDGDNALGEMLIERNLMTDDQLKTALEFQSTLGGDLRSIVVKLGYVKDSVLADLVAQEENVGAATNEITADVIDFEAIKNLPKDVLEKHQVIPLVSGGPHLVLAMADPNDLMAIEEIQFLVNKSVEPAVATKQAIRKALNTLHELKKEHQARTKPKKGTLNQERLKALRETPVDRLIRAYLIIQIEKGELSVDDLLARAGKL